MEYLPQIVSMLQVAQTELNIHLFTGHCVDIILVSGAHRSVHGNLAVSPLEDVKAGCKC